MGIRRWLKNITQIRIKQKMLVINLLKCIEEMFLKIKQAYDFLTDKAKLEAYLKHSSNIHARNEEIK